MTLIIRISSSLFAIAVSQQAFHRLFPRSETVVAFEFVESVEHTAFEPHESGIRVMAIHHFAPRAQSAFAMQLPFPRKFAGFAAGRLRRNKTQCR